MKKFLPLIVICVLAAGCTGYEDPVSLIDLQKWSGEEPLNISDGTITLNAPLQTWVYQPGLLGTFKNFELIAEIKTDSGAAAAIQFHTKMKDAEAGYEIRIDNSAVGNWDRLLKTGSLSSIRNVYYHMVNDGEWFELRLRVVENTIAIHINNFPVVYYAEPTVPFRTAELDKRTLTSGTFALKTLFGHTGISIRTLDVKPLPPGKIYDEPDPGFTRAITQLHIRQLPVVDYHVHIKGALTLEDALATSATTGINYGIAANCGLKFPIQTDEELQNYLVSIDGLPVFKAMQAEGREWVDLFSPELVAQFDYAFTDAMTWTNRNGTRMRLWIPEETEVGDPEDFMDQLVAQIEKVVEEPIAIYVNPTFLPVEIADRYDELWTDERIDRVIMALKRNNVALEIASRYRIPGEKFIQRGLEEGIKFAMGTNNTDATDLGRLDWALKMVEKFNLQPTDMFLPGNMEEPAE
jgi:hypothetical protein